MRTSRTLSPTRLDEADLERERRTHPSGQSEVTVPLLSSSRPSQTFGAPRQSAHGLYNSQPLHRLHRSRSLERTPARAAAQSKRIPQLKGGGFTKAQPGRQVHKTVFLPVDSSNEESDQTASDLDAVHDHVHYGAAYPEQQATREEKHPILVYCKANSINLKKLVYLLRTRFSESNVQTYAECVHCPYHKPGGGELMGDMFFFEYGVAIFWELRSPYCAEVLGSVVKSCQVLPLDLEEVEVDEFALKYSAKNEPASISNDTITISKRAVKDPHIKMAISHALAQSTKLCVYEQRVGELVDETKTMPEHLATSGKVGRTRKQIAQLIGKVFIQKSAVNLLSSVLDTPEYFWSAPDQQQVLYKSICEYLELDQRVQVLNNRFEVLTELLNIVREHENNVHSARLEWIVIWLIVVEVVLGLLECASILGFVQSHDH